MKTFDLYGARGFSTVQLRDKVSALLGIVFEERDSAYLGGAYFQSGDEDGEHFVVLSNDASNPDMVEPAFSDTTVVPEVNRTARSEVLREKLTGVPGIVLLRTTST